MIEPSRTGPRLIGGIGYLSLLAGAIVLAASMVFVHPAVPFMVIIGISVVALSIRDPYIFMCAFVVFILARLSEFIPLLGQLAAGKILMLGAIGIFLTAKMIERNRSFVHSKYTKWLMLLTIAVVFSSLQGTNPSASMKAFKEVFIKLPILYLIYINTVTTKEKSIYFQVIISITIAFLGGYALLAKMLGVDPMTGMALVEGSRAGLQGALGDPNDLALVLLMGIPFSLVAVLELRGAKRFGFIVLLLISVGGVLSTQSRGGLLGLSAVVGLILKDRIRSKVVVGAIVVVFLGGMAGVAGLSDRTSGGGNYSDGLDTSAAGRIVAWETGFRMFARHPIFGVGYNRFLDNFLNYVVNPVDRYPHEPHNSLVKALAETGAAGFIPFFMMIVLSLRGSYKLKKTGQRGSENLENVLKLSTFSTLMGVLVAAFFLNHSWSWFIYILHMQNAANEKIFGLDEMDTG
ncbi:MAG: hypothetical protein GY847_36125 [Proteobacteria bacterium]|nr:hypothetical protein [Pseudomonadota bacterium]